MEITSQNDCIVFTGRITHTAIDSEKQIQTKKENKKTTIDWEVAGMIKKVDIDRFDWAYC